MGHEVIVPINGSQSSTWTVGSGSSMGSGMGSDASGGDQGTGET